MSWHARALYVGPPFDLSAHRNAVAVLALALDGTLELARDARRPALGFTSCRSALIEPNRLHRLNPKGGEYAFLYLDALSGELAALRRRCRVRGRNVSFGLDAEGASIDLLAAMPRSPEGWRRMRTPLQSLLGLAEAAIDARVRAACDRLAGAAPPAGIAELAAAVRLSPSRLQTLFRLHTGVPVRRYRLWLRMRAALAAAAAGRSLTEAALAAGFASSAHFTASFREMFGMAPSRLMGAAPLWIDDGATACPQAVA